MTAGPDPRSRAHDALAAGIGLVAFVLLAGSPWLVDQDGPDPFYKGPLIFPLIALALTVAGALPGAIRLVRERTRSTWHLDGHGVPKRAVGLFVLMVFFPTAISLVGLAAAAFAFVVAGLTVVGVRKPVRALLIAAAVAAGLHLAFISFLDIWFPTPAVVEWVEG